MRVLIGVDGSTGSFAAVAQAARLLSPERDQVTLYYTPPSAGLAPRGGVDPAVVERARQALAQAVFAEAESRLGPAWTGKPATQVGTQKPVLGLLRAAEECRAELIVVGAHGAGPLEKLLVGSVSQSVARQAPVAVLVVRPDQPRRPEGYRVLWASDGSSTSLAAHQLLERFTWPEGTVGQAISVIESMFAGEIPAWLAEKARDSETEAMARVWVESHEQEKQAALAKLQAECQTLPESFRRNPPLVLEGHPAEQILAQAKQLPADLIVVGARGLGGVARLLMGSTSERVLSHAACSVLVVHEPPQA